MSDTVTVGRRLIPIEHIAIVEPYDPTQATRIQSEREFKARVVLIDRESVLMPASVAEFEASSGFRMLPADGVLTNPAVHFSVEHFEPQQGFTPRKPYKSRLLWRDLDGQVQSRLLLSEPEQVLSIAVRGEEVRTATEASEPIVLAKRRSQRCGVRKPAEEPEPA